MPLYNTAVDFNSDNQDVIEVQSFSFRSKLLFFLKSIALIIYVCGYLPSVFSSISEKYVFLGCDQVTSLAIDGHLIIYPIPFLCLEQVWVWFASTVCVGSLFIFTAFVGIRPETAALYIIKKH